MKSPFMGDFENYGLSIPKHKYLITSLSNQAQKTPQVKPNQCIRETTWVERIIQWHKYFYKSPQDIYLNINQILKCGSCATVNNQIFINSLHQADVEMNMEFKKMFFFQEDT